MIEIPLTQDKTAQIDEEDYAVARHYRWCAQKTKDGVYYAVTNVTDDEGKTKRIYMHRMLTNAPAEYVVTHKDGNTLNNSRGNLRVSIQSQKKRAVTLEGKTKVRSIYRGLKYIPKGKKHWAASITVGGEHTHLGVFETELEAAAARDEAAIKQWGVFATLNIKREAA